jgi:WhiB family transcriptional regulator, redox-sensing transcriptional regulator
MSRYDESWTVRAACAQHEPDELFVQGAAQRQARELCFSCPVRLECLVDALDNRIQFGVWGGMTERERRSLLRRAPSVESWRSTLADLDREHITELISQRWPVPRPRRAEAVAHQAAAG